MAGGGKGGRPRCSAAQERLWPRCKVPGRAGGEGGRGAGRGAHPQKACATQLRGTAAQFVSREEAAEQMRRCARNPYSCSNVLNICCSCKQTRVVADSLPVAAVRSPQNRPPSARAQPFSSPPLLSSLSPPFLSPRFSSPRSPPPPLLSPPPPPLSPLSLATTSVGVQGIRGGGIRGSGGGGSGGAGGGGGGGGSGG